MMGGVRNPRALLAVIVLLAVLAAVAVAVFVGGGSEGGSEGRLRTVGSELTLERFVVPTTGQPELLVSLPDRRLNAPQTTGGETSVLLRCFDRSGALKIRQQTAWPLLEEVGYPPHIHQLARPDVLDVVRACRLTGPGIDFGGRVPGRLPTAE